MDYTLIAHHKLTKYLEKKTFSRQKLSFSILKLVSYENDMI